MITRIEARGFRSLRDVDVSLRPVQYLVGPNASGKSTLMDVLPFLRTVVTVGVEEAFRERTDDARDLFWGRRDSRAYLNVEARIPAEMREPGAPHAHIRYEAEVISEPGRGPALPCERVLLKGPDSAELTLIDKADGRTAYNLGSADPGVALRPLPFRTGIERSALALLPEGQFRVEVIEWFRELLRSGLQPVHLSETHLRQASPSVNGPVLRPDGSNLPWMVKRLGERHPRLFEDWIAHLRTVLPDLEDIRVVIREDVRHAFLMLHYRGGLEAPSWVISGGSLRLIALTLIAYLPDFRGVSLIEEPENGIHPGALFAIQQSLSSLYDSQVLVATHSPMLVTLAKPADVLCFAKDEAGATVITSGESHPALRNWHGEVPLGAMFASGILS